MLGRAKIAVIGAGMVGSSAALKMAQKELGDIVLVDVVEFVAEGKALDMAESAPLDGFDVALVGKTNDYSVIAGSDVVVITAGVARKPGMSRMDLLMTNAGIVEGIAQQIRQHAPDAIVIVVTNPLDVMTYIAWKVTGFSRERVMGQAGVSKNFKRSTPAPKKSAKASLIGKRRGQRRHRDAVATEDFSAHSPSSLSLRSRRLDDLAFLQARCADLHPSDATVDADAHLLDVRPQPNFGVLVGVADTVTVHAAFAANVATPHSCFPPFSSPQSGSETIGGEILTHVALTLSRVAKL